MQNDEHDADHDREWRFRMRTSGEAVPPPSDRVKETLTTLGVLGPQRRPVRSRMAMRVLAGTAASILVFALGHRVGRGSVGPRQAAAGRFALFVLGDGTDGVPEASKVAEYGQWLTTLSQSGIGVSGEKLRNPGWLLGAGSTRFDAGIDPAPADRITGFFIIAAPTPDSALAIAQGMPHLKHGGRLVLREIEPT
jgi:hypothetical protein